MPLDGRGNRLLVRRTPGDQLRVRLAGDSLVFSPGEKLRLEVEPCLLPAPADAKLTLRAQLFPAGQDRELWSAERELRAAPPESVSLEIPLNQREGVYDVLLTAMHASSWPRSVSSALNWKRTVAERKVQLVVIDPRRPPPPGRSGELSQVIEIDSANPRWWDLKRKLPQWSRLTRWSKTSAANGDMQTARHALGELTQLNPNGASPDVSWHAYTLSLSQPGRPHVLEVEYPSDTPQTLGLSILEPNAAGVPAPIGLDSGVDVDEEPLKDAPPHWAKHRLIFWPRTNAPIARGDESPPAASGGVRQDSRFGRLGAFAPRRPSRRASQRLLAAYMDRPLLAENFSAAESLDPWSGRSLQDWNTFRDGGLRLVEYLHYVGYNGLMISVAADGSAIYPSATLEPTPRYDTGVFFGAGQDPVRKDVLEMLLRLFDREDLQLIPSMEFAAPLPELEALRRGDAKEADGIEWIGADGAAWRQTTPRARGLAPYYNALGPARAGGDAPRRAGVCRSLRPAPRRWPGWPCGCPPGGMPSCPGRTGAWTTARSPASNATPGCKSPARGRTASPPGPPSSTATSIASQWLQWRADQLHQFYRRVQQTLAAGHSGATLCLAGAEMFSGPEIEAQLRPVLPPRNTLVESLLYARHRPAAIPGRSRDRAPAAGTDRPAPAAGRPGDRFGNQPDARRRRRLPQLALPRQPLLPLPGGSPRRLARPAGPAEIGVHLAADAGGAVGSGEPAAIRPQPRGDGFANPPGRRLDAHHGPGRGDARRDGDLSPACRPCGSRRRATGRTSRTRSR